MVTADVVRAKHFELEDSQGNLRAYMEADDDGTTGLYIMGQQQESHISMSVDANNAPAIRMLHGGDNGASVSLTVLTTDEGVTPVVNLRTQSGASVTVSVSQDGAATVHLNSQEDSDALLSAHGNGTASLRLTNGDGSVYHAYPE